MATVDFSKCLAAKRGLDRTQGEAAKHSSSYYRLVPPGCRTEAPLTSSRCCNCSAYRELPQYTSGTDKSLARPGRKQARKHVRHARDFNNIETRAVIKFFFPLQGKAPKEIHAILTETLPCFPPGRTKELSASLYFPNSRLLQIIADRNVINGEQDGAVLTRSTCVLVAQHPYPFTAPSTNRRHTSRVYSSG